MTNVFGEGESPAELHSISLVLSVDRLTKAVDQQISDEVLVMRAAEQVLNQLVTYNQACFPDAPETLPLYTAAGMSEPSAL